VTEGLKRILVSVGVVGVLAGPAPGAGAGTIQVTCPPDDLQAKIDAANPGDVLEITGKCDGTFTVDKDLTLRGAPSATLDGGGAGTTLLVSGAPTPNVLLEGLTVTGGIGGLGEGGGIHNEGMLSVASSTVSGNEGSFGGGIYSEGPLTLMSSTVSGNQAGFGGGILSFDSGATLIDSTVGGNTATSGGGIYNESSNPSFPQLSPLSLMGSAVTGNMANDFGGGIRNADGEVSLDDSTVDGNNALSGGGINNDSGTLTITRTTVSGNKASNRGGIENGPGSELTLTNSTVSGNQSDGEAGGILNLGQATITSSTVTNNTADADGDGNGDGGGIYNSGSTTITNTILAGNHDPTSDPDCYGPLDSEAYNIVGILSPGCGFSPVAADQTGTPASPLDPLLGPLANNGGPTMTHALAKGSPALDAANPATSPATDQRGVPRNPDIGAYEQVLCKKVPVNRLGTEGNDILVGTPGSDGVLAFGGKDVVRTAGGKDAVCAGAGKDVVKGGGGKDLLFGQGGRDKLFGQGGNDTLNGGPGKDTCKPGGGKKNKLLKCEKP